MEYFANMMNERARKAGAQNSSFVNAHGYHDPGHYTTAYDLAMIGREAAKTSFYGGCVHHRHEQYLLDIRGTPDFGGVKTGC